MKNSVEFDINNKFIKNMSKKKEIIWLNTELGKFESSIQDMKITFDEVLDAEERLKRFAPFILKCFPDTKNHGGLIESPLIEIEKMKCRMNDIYGANIKGNLLLKMDSHLPVAGSVKARGGVYEILKYAEELALSNNLIKQEDDYSAFLQPSMKQFFSNYTIHVGSTGNLGLAIGIISTVIGFRVSVHMSNDAKEWKKNLLRSKGVNVIEYSGDYSKAVSSGRELAKKDLMAYFIDDEKSKNLFLGYAVAALRLQKQLNQLKVIVDKTHPLYVYLPCGVGGAPGGIAFGLKHIFKDNVNVFFVEPTESCCMALSMITKLKDKICIQDIGLSGITDADGLAVGRASPLVCEVMEKILSGIFTVNDEMMHQYLLDLVSSENIFIEISACASFDGVKKINTKKDCIDYQMEKNVFKYENQATHIAWATGGKLIPEDIKSEYLLKQNCLRRKQND